MERGWRWKTEMEWEDKVRETRWRGRRGLYTRWALAQLILRGAKEAEFQYGHKCVWSVWLRGGRRVLRWAGPGNRRGDHGQLCVTPITGYRIRHLTWCGMPRAPWSALWLVDPAKRERDLELIDAPQRHPHRVLINPLRYHTLPFHLLSHPTLHLPRHIQLFSHTKPPKPTHNHQNDWRKVRRQG
jgi:hypothetical protein